MNKIEVNLKSSPYTYKAGDLFIDTTAEGDSVYMLVIMDTQDVKEQVTTFNWALVHLNTGTVEYSMVSHNFEFSKRLAHKFEYLGRNLNISVTN
jgi:hypothetical protein